MTPAEFDTRRRLLGLSQNEAADFIGVDRNTVGKWIRGKSHFGLVSQKKAMKLDDLEDAMNAGVEEMLEVFEDKHPDEIQLVRYRSQEAVDAGPQGNGLPHGAHSVMIGWTFEALEANGRTVEIVWGD